MGKARTPVNFSSEEVDLSDLSGKTNQLKPTSEQERKIKLQATESGFISRERKKMGRPRNSPYTAQFGGRCREGMKPLFQEIGEALHCQDTVTLELAILALIEKEGLDNLLIKYKELGVVTE
jgi:hypothetical protein